jgi:hypothetical protein
MNDWHFEFMLPVATCVGFFLGFMTAAKWRWRR